MRNVSFYFENFGEDGELIDESLVIIEASDSDPNAVGYVVDKNCFSFDAEQGCIDLENSSDSYQKYFEVIYDKEHRRCTVKTLTDLKVHLLHIVNRED